MTYAYTTLGSLHLYMTAQCTQDQTKTKAAIAQKNLGFLLVCKASVA